MGDPLTVLEELGAELERVARAADGRRRGGVRRLPRRTLVLVVVATLLLAAAVAVAAGGLLTGEPIKAPPGTVFKSDRGLGKPLPGAQLSALRVTDPAGGSPWGLRVVRTDRHFGCVQVGRLDGGRLGALGQDGAFANDGRFHELPAATLAEVDCQPLDGAGHAFVAVSYQGRAASGLRDGCAVRPQPKLPASIVAHQPKGYTPPPLCPADDVRIMYYGLLGPQGRSVGYRDADGRLVTQDVSGPDGAYLVVLRPRPGHPPRGYYSSGLAPASGLAQVTYRDGQVCRIRRPDVLGGAKSCGPVGYVVPRGPQVTTEQVRTPVRARVIGGRIVVSFRARVASDSRSAYEAEIQAEHPGRCGFAGLGAGTRHDVAAGTVAQIIASLPTSGSSCAGSLLTGTVFFVGPGAREQLAPYVPRVGHDPVVGTFRLTVP